MNVSETNTLLATGTLDHPELWPSRATLAQQPLQFDFEFGLNELPEAPGLITVRGARQFGKSTWLESQLRASIKKYGRGSAYYLNGDEIASAEDLIWHLRQIATLYAPDAKIRRLFIDEITAIPAWERGVKRVIDEGLLRKVLIVTTGSRATDLRRGGERLPGRKGRLAKSDYIFLPVSYRQFHAQAEKKFGKKTWMAYLLTGGSPLACNELYQRASLPEYFIALTRDWIFGELVASGRSRMSLLNLLPILFRHGGQPVGFAKLARDGGLANNTVAAGYIEQLSDLLCLLPAWAWDANTRVHQLRKPCKFHFVNLAAVVALHPEHLRSVPEFERLPAALQGLWLEWLVAQEIWRRAVLSNVLNPEAIGFWASKEHEIDFVTPQHELIEVKRGRAGPLDFSWFPQIFPKQRLTVICATPFATDQVSGVTMHDFLLDDPTYKKRRR